MKSSSIENSSNEEFRGDTGWKESLVSKDRRYHTLKGLPLYDERFDEVMPFHEPGLAPAREDTEWFHIRQDGKRAYGSSFDRAWGFYYGLAAVIRNGKSFHITPEGVPAYSERFSWVGNFQENVCVVRDLKGNYFHILPNGKRLYSESYSYVGDFKEGYSAVFDKTGKSFHIDLKGNPVYSSRYLEVGQFHKGIAPARDASGAFHLDRSGNRIYSDVFSDVEPFYNGRAKVRTRDGRLVTVDEEGNLLDLIQSNNVNPLMKMSHDLVGYWKSFLLKGAIDLGIFHMLPSDTHSLSDYLKIPEERVRLLLMALRERGYVNLAKGDVWTIGNGYEPITKVKAEVLRSIADHWINQMVPLWNNLLETIESNSRSRGHRRGNVFRTIEGMPEGFEHYQHTMEFYASMDYGELPEMIDFSGYRTIIDAGGGTGYLLSSILEKAKRSKGYVLDLPVTAKIQRSLGGNGRKISRISCDLFKRWPVKGDAVVLAKVLHDWDDIAASRIIRRARESLGKQGSLYIVERVMTETETSGSILSLHQFIVNGGMERTIDGYSNLMDSNGMKIEETIRLPSGMSVIRCSKKGGDER